MEIELTKTPVPVLPCIRLFGQAVPVRSFRSPMTGHLCLEFIRWLQTFAMYGDLLRAEYFHPQDTTKTHEISEVGPKKCVLEICCCS